MYNEQHFDNFLVDASNRFAFLLCNEIVQSTDRIHAPLCLHGPSGCGKTHLLCAVGDAVITQDSDKAVCFVTAEDIVKDLIDSIDGGYDMKLRYSAVDVLLIDNLQCLMGRSSTIEEMHRLLFWLQQKGTRIVMATECAAGRPDPFASWLSPLVMDGVSVAVSCPRLPLRRRFLKRESHAMGLSLPEEVIDRVAHIRKADFSMLSGILKKMHLSVAVSGKPIDLAWCDEHL